MPQEDMPRMMIGAACEVLEGVAHASAEAFRTVNSHVSAEDPSLVKGILKGNARFLEQMSQTMNAVAERFRAKPTEAPPDQA